MVVKFADTQKEKDQKRVHHVGGSPNLWGGIGINSLPPQYLTVTYIIQMISFIIHFPLTGNIEGSAFERWRKFVAIERAQCLGCPATIGSVVAEFAGQHSR